jgi:hypothetical protein
MLNCNVRGSTETGVRGLLVEIIFPGNFRHRLHRHPNIFTTTSDLLLHVWHFFQCSNEVVACCKMNIRL